MLSVTHRYWKFLLSCLLVGLCAASAFAEGTVTDVKVTDGTGTLKVEVSANGPVQHRAKALTQPQKMIVVDIFPAVLGKNVKATFPVNRGLVDSVRVKQYTDNTVRVYVEVITMPEYKVVTASGSKGLTLAISESNMAEGKGPTTPAPVAQESPVAAPKATPKPIARPTQPKPVQPIARTPVQPRPQPRPITVVPSTPKQQALTASGSSSLSALRPRPAPRRARPRTKLVSLDFVNADLVYVIKVLAKEMGRNVYIGPGVEGSVTVTLKSVPVEGALALILKMQESDFEYKIVSNGTGGQTLIVAPPEKLATIPDDIFTSTAGGVGTNQVNIPPGEGVRQEILLEKAPAAKVMEFLQGQYKNVQFTAHPTMNGFYVYGLRKDVLQIKAEVPNLDRIPEPPPPPQREFVAVKYGDINEIKALLATLVPDVQYNVDTRQNILILEGAPGAIDQVKELLAELDRPTEQVVIDVKVVDLTEGGRKQLGVTWGSQNSPGALNTTFTESATAQYPRPTEGPGVIPGGATRLDPLTAAGVPPFTGFAINALARTPFIITSNLQFLVTQNEAKVLAAPRVATQSDKDALIHIGDKFPIVYFDPRAGQFQVQYVDIGIKLDVKPSIKADGYIVVELRPEVSTLVELVNGQYPRTAVRTINTSMRVKDGDTIVLGGLIREEDLQAVTKIPLLGDLPIIGTMFRSVNITKSRNEVVMMLTPHIMK